MTDKVKDLTDYQLLLCIKEGDKVAFNQIYKKYWSKLYIYSLNVLKDREICEDIVQEIFYKLWIRKNEIEISDLQSYLYSAVRNQIYKHFRNNKYKKELESQLNSFICNWQEFSFAESELHNIINKEIEKLPEQRRKIFILSKKENYSYQEIADLLNISIQTIKNQMSKALKTLRNSLKSLKSFIL